VCVFVLFVSFFWFSSTDGSVRPYIEISIRLCYRSRLINLSVPLLVE
jgi:hypothetical protein